MQRRVIGVLLLCASVAAGAFGQPAGAATASDDQNGARVWQYFDVSYSQQTCSGEVGYRLNAYFARWYREIQRRRISSAKLHAGQVFTQNCNGDVQNPRRYETDVNPRFDTARWTPQYSHGFDWPYSFEAFPDNSLIGINMKGVIRNKAGEHLGSLCSKVYLVGQGSCP